MCPTLLTAASVSLVMRDVEEKAGVNRNGAVVDLLDGSGLCCERRNMQQ